MLKIYIPDYTKNPNPIGGGWTAKNNLLRGLKGKIEVVATWQEADIVFIFSITTMLKNEIMEAKKAGKFICLRVDNIPRKSRNHRMSPAERMTEIGGMADLVIYQSYWAKIYAGYLIDNEHYVVLSNGVATEIFNTRDRHSDGFTYLYINYNDNPNKRFDEALYWFDMEWRKNNKAHLIVAGNAPKMYLEHPEWHWDLPIQEQQVEYVGVKENMVDVAQLMKRCDYLLVPYFAEASSNTLREGLACGLKPLGLNDVGGNKEIYNESQSGVTVSIQDMADAYLKEFNKLFL